MTTITQMTITQWIKHYGDNVERLVKSSTTKPEFASIDLNEAYAVLGAVVRGGFWNNGSYAGVFAVVGSVDPSDASPGIGFRCAPSHRFLFADFEGFCELIRRAAVWREKTQKEIHA